jgi:glycosyltransferase involved in cell wall biosynthesis
MQNRKLRVLIVSEHHKLSTGYAVMTKNYLSRWFASGKYELAELAIFGDERESQAPWKVYGNLPKNDQETQEYHSHPLNPLGKFNFDRVCLDFLPDICLDIRDIFMTYFEFDSCFRPYYSLIHQPTVDAAPQNNEWLAWFQRADAIIPYTKFGYDQVKSQDNGTINVVGHIPPCVDYEVFKPIPDKAGLRKFYGLDPDILMIGMVCRNQKRKLISDLFDSFAQTLAKAPDSIRKKLYLFLHTSYPEKDAFWDFGPLLNEFGIHNRVYFSYTCRNCGKHGPYLFQDARSVCQRCGQGALTFPNTGNGIPSEYLSQLYNLLDFYTHFSSIGGFEIPCAEAAGCGIPLLVTDYSATEDFKTTLKAYPLKIKEYFREIETGRYFSVPDKDDFIEKVIKFLSLPFKMRQQRGDEVAKAARLNYNWDKSAAQWMQVFDQLPYKDWAAPPKIIYPSNQVPQGLSNNDFVNWTLANVAGEPERINTYFSMKLLKQLNIGLGEDFAPFDRQKMYQMFVNRRGYLNHGEQLRAQRISDLQRQGS